MFAGASVGLAIAVGLVVACGSAVTLRGSFEHGIYAILGLWVGAILVALGLAVLLLALLPRLRRPSLRRAGVVCVASALPFFLQVPGCAAGGLLGEVDERAAKEYCESLAAPLEDWKRKHGEYPRSLASIGVDLDDLPRLVTPNCYQANRSGFTFTISDPRGMFLTHYLCSETMRWEEEEED